MVKTSETVTNEIQNTSKSSGTAKILSALFVLVVLGGAGAGFYLYRETQLQKASLPDPRIVELQNSLQALQNRLNLLENDNAGKISGREIAVLNERIDSQTRLNQEVLDSKAGTNTVLNMLSRLDSLETRVNNLGQITSDTALILTAAMMVKEAAAGGQPFEYEAEVLRQLSAGTSVEPQAELIGRYSADGLPCPKKLIADFNGLYEAAHATETTALESETAEMPEDKAKGDWKDKINQKLSQLITVKYHNADGQVVEKSIPEDEVYALVNSGEFDAAVIKMSNNPMYQTEEFQKWQNLVAAKSEFQKALRRIQAVTLAAMKIGHLKTSAAE